MIASLSIDLDNKWAYLSAAGRSDWKERPSYLPTAIPRVTEMLRDLNLPLTVFLVGRDLQQPVDRDAITRFDELKAWEPANHTLHHLPWMHTMRPEEVADEIEITDGLIRETTGRSPLGFRGPGFSCSDAVLSVLVRNGYLYDASIFPTSIAPLSRAFFLWKTDLPEEQREQAKQLYGGWSSLWLPNRPFPRQVDDHRLWEIPVTVLPLMRTPIHFSYLTYLASHSVTAAKCYFRTAIGLCRITGTPPSLLLHPPDFLGREDDQDMSFFPGMKLPREEKLSLVHWALELYARNFDVRCMIDQLRTIDPTLPNERLPNERLAKNATHPAVVSP